MGVGGSKRFNVREEMEATLPSRSYRAEENDLINGEGVDQGHRLTFVLRWDRRRFPCTFLSHLLHSRLEKATNHPDSPGVITGCF
jgi:hypothetical protein